MKKKGNISYQSSSVIRVLYITLLLISKEGIFLIFKDSMNLSKTKSLQFLAGSG